MSSQESGVWNHKFQKYECRAVLRGDIVKDDSGSCAVFTEQGSSASQMTAAQVMDVKATLPGCAGQAADAVSAYTANESTRLRMGESLPNHHEDHIAGKGDNSLQHYNLVHKFIPMPQAMNIPCSESSGGQGMGKIGKDFGVELDESQK